MSSGTQAMQPEGGQPINAAPASPSTTPPPLQQPTTIPPQQQQLNTDLVQHAQALEQQVLQLQAQLNVQPPRMRELKLPEPHEYKGTKDKTSIREWIRDIEEIFIMGGIPLDHRSSIIYAAHYLRDDAKTWYKMHEANITTWEQFKTVMIDRYRDPREVDKVRTRLMSMRQINTDDTYTTAFDRATLEFTEVTGYAPREDELVWMYREGLKPQIKTFLAARGIVNDLKQLQEIALEIDASLYSTRMSNTSPPSSFKSHAHRSSHGNTHNTNTHSRSPQYNNTFNRYQQGNRYNQTRPPQSFNHPPQFNQYSNRGYAPMDTSNSIAQHKPQHVNQIDTRRDVKKATKGNCFNCGKTGHFIRECPSNKAQVHKQSSNVIMQESVAPADDTVLIINEMNSTQVPKNNKKLLTYMGMVAGHPAYILIDSGATNNYVSDSFVNKHKIYTEPIGDPAEAVLADGTSLSVTRMAPGISICIQEYNDVIDANVLELEKYDIVLSMAWLDAHGPTISYRNKSITFEHNGKTITLTPLPIDNDVHTQTVPTTNDITTIQYDRKLSLQVHTIHDKSQTTPSPMQMALKQVPSDIDKQYVSKLAMVVQQYSDVFPKDLPAGTPEHVVMHEIPFKPDAKPVKQHPYPLAPKYLPFVKETIDMLLSKSFITRSNSPSQVPITIADKDGGKDYRFCIDYRAINSQTVSDATPPPNIQMLFDQLQGATIFTKIDLRSAYWQVQVKPADRWKTAFTCRYGHYEWTVMPFGLKNAPATFVKLMDEVFQDYLDKFIIVYLDDIVVYSTNVDEHLHHLQIIFSRLREHKLYAKLEKCQFMQQQIKFLGHLVSADGIRVNPDKVKAIVNWSTPKTVKDIRAFLGISGYYRKFIQNYSKVASPLTELLKDEQHFKWGEEQQHAFDLLKHATTSAPILTLPNTHLPFKVTTDACSRAIGAVLSQNNGQGDQPVAYLSKKLSGTEQNWPAHEQELYAVVYALKHWKYYLLGSMFDVYTDSIALKTIMTQKNLSRKQFRWVMELQEFLPFNIIHVSGKKNIVADALSRNAYAMDANIIYEASPIEEELEELLRDQQATSSSTSSLLGEYLDDDNNDDNDYDDSDTLIDRIRAAYNHDPHTKQHR